MNIGKLLGKAVGWTWKNLVRPGLEDRAAQVAVEAIKKHSEKRAKAGQEARDGH